jgi:hypothetical protein
MLNTFSGTGIVTANLIEVVSELGGYYSVDFYRDAPTPYGFCPDLGRGLVMSDGKLNF